MLRRLGPAFALLLAAKGAHGARTEGVASIGLMAPTPSPYRGTAEQLGYDRRGLRNVYEAELGALRSLAWWISVGPIARAYVGRLGAPYEGVDPISTYAGALGARVELELFPWPRIFAWTEPSLGIGWIGSEGARRSIGFWGLRAGIGIGTAREASSLRFRFGYAHAPTFGKVTDAAGPFNWGGFTFQIDGVLRVGE